jgi:hypothetical protein
LVAAAAACLALLIARPSERDSVRPTPHERAKGQGLELRVYRQREGRVERVAEGTEAAAGELLQLGFVRAGHVHGVLLSIDGRGAVTLHWPLVVGASTALPPDGGEHLLPQSYQLDDAPAFERFVFLGAAAPLRVDAILASAKQLARDPLRARDEPLRVEGVHEQRSFLVRKKNRD